MPWNCLDKTSPTKDTTRGLTRGAFASANMDSTKGDSKDFHFQVEWNRWKGVRDADEVMKLICDFV